MHPSATMSPKIPAAVFDWDGTLRRDYTLRAWIQFLAKNSILRHAQLAHLHALFNQEDNPCIPYEHFAESVIQAYGQALAGIHQEALLKHASSFIEADLDNLYSFVRPLFNHLREQGLLTIVISGSPFEPLKAYKDMLGIDLLFTTQIARSANGTYTGRISQNPTLRAVKQKIMDELAHDYTFHLALGNTSSDLPLLERAAHSFYLTEGASHPLSRSRRSIHCISHEAILPHILELFPCT